MYIFHIITRGDTNGGAQAHVLNLVKEQIRQGHRVSIICGKSSQVFEELKILAVHVFSLECIKRDIHPYYDVLSIIKIIKIIKSEQPHIIACHTSKAGVIGRFAGKLSSTKTIYTPHSWIFSEPSHAKKKSKYIKIEKIMAFFCDKIITVSKNDFNIAKKLSISVHKCITIHNGMKDTDKKLIKKNYLIKNKIKLITVARLEKPKDYNTLFLALSAIKDKSWTLDIFGDGSLRDSLELKSQQLGISDKVIFHGDCQDIEQRLFASDIFILISQSEGFPISIIEAMRTGLPVIASDVGGIPEAVKQGENGMLINNKNIDSLVNAIEYFISNPKKIAKYGRNGRVKYEKLLTAKIMSDKTLALYNDVLIGRK
jgi:glycosyltransferase involved in cell wall biosynthesis